MKKYLDHGYKFAKPIVSPLLNYALGWFSPELLGSGFVVHAKNDSSFYGTIPYSKLNSNSQSEIHAGLVTNCGFELARQLLNRHLGPTPFQIENFETTLKKNQTWNKSLILKLEINEVILDRFFIELQKNATANLIFDISIHKKSSKTAIKDSVKTKDNIKFDLVVRSNKLLA